MAAQIVLADPSDIFQTTDGRPAQGMIRPEQSSHHQIGIGDHPFLIEILQGLFTDDPPFQLDPLQFGAQYHRSQNIQPLADMVGMDAGVVAGRVGVGGGVDRAAQLLEGGLDRQ